MEMQVLHIDVSDEQGCLQHKIPVFKGGTRVDSQRYV